MQITKSNILSAITSSPPLEIDPLEPSFSVSIESKITSPLASGSNTFEIEAPETSLPKVIEPDYIKSETTQPEAPQLSAPITSGPSSSLPLSQTQSQPIYLGPDSEPLSPGLMSIEEIPYAELEASSPIRVGGHFY